MYTIKLLKQNFLNLLFSSFEKMGKNWPRLEEEVKKDEFPDNVKKQSLKIKNDVIVFANWKFVTLLENGLRYAWII